MCWDRRVSELPRIALLTITLMPMLYGAMTHAVNGLRQLTVGGIDSRLWVAIAVLVGVRAVSLTASAWSARRNRQYTMERLHPPIEV